MSIDKQQLYGAFTKSHQRQQRLSEMATRKALDLPLDDDVNITQTTTNHGPNLVSLLVLAGGLLAGGTGIGLGLPALWNEPATAAMDPPKASEPPPKTVALDPESTEFRVTFYAEDGRPIDVNQVEPIPPKETN